MRLLTLQYRLSHQCGLKIISGQFYNDFFFFFFTILCLQETEEQKELNHPNPNVTPRSVTAHCEEVYVVSCLWSRSLSLTLSRQVL